METASGRRERRDTGERERERTLTHDRTCEATMVHGMARTGTQHSNALYAALHAKECPDGVRLRGRGEGGRGKNE